MKPESSNRCSIGKQLRKWKGLRKHDPQAQVIQPDQKLKEYIEYLKGKGVIINNLSVARFKTKNGLPYIGLITDQLFPTNKIFIRVPQSCLLNTRVAYFSQIKDMLQDNPQYFSKQLNSNWEDHILLAFILYEYHQGKNSDWYHLINNLPREIDYVIFWQQSELLQLQDPILVKMAHSALVAYQKQAAQFMDIASKYPHLFPKDLLTEENIRWIHIHLVTRCFGKYFEYTTMVPFAQLINHQCTDVYYSMYYHQDNPHDTKQEFYDEKVLTEEEIDDIKTSDGSYDSQDYSDPEDYYQSEPEKTEHYEDDDVSITSMSKDLYNYMYNFLNFGDNVSLGFLLEMHEAVELLRRSNQKANYKKVQLARMQTVLSYYLTRLKAAQIKCKFTKLFHNSTLEQKYMRPTVEEPRKQPQPGVSYFPDVWPKDQFDQFLMLSSTKDQFQKHSQVFFCYGRLSNRMMLMRYGMSLEHNKYNHFYLRLPIDDYTQGFSVFPSLLHKHRLPRTKSIKVRRTKLCTQLLMFFRCLEWKFSERVSQIFTLTNFDTQLKVIQRAKETLREEMSHFSESLQQNQKKLHDPKTGYHQYFSTVYKLQKQRIIASQLQMLSVAHEVLARMGKGVPLQMAMLQVPELETSFQMRTNRLMMREYFDNFFKQ